MLMRRIDNHHDDHRRNIALIREATDETRDEIMKDALSSARKLENLDYKDYHFPVRQYLIFCNFMSIIVNSTILSNWIFFCIILAGILVGVQTYPGMDTNPIVMTLDTIVLYSFAIEIVMKIFADGLGPQFYFIGFEWKWNWFDLIIVIVSFLPIKGSQVKLARLARLARLAKVFKRIQNLQMIIMGLIGGMKSIFYIVALLVLTFYIFAIAGIIFFRENDPWHWHSVEVSMITLLRITTFDGWGDIMYINYFGCDVYGTGPYLGYYVLDPEEHVAKLGGATWCGTPKANPFITGVYMVVFCTISAFCMLSLFIGAVTSAMFSSMVSLRLEAEEARKAQQKKQMVKVKEKYRAPEKLDLKSKRKLLLMQMAFTGQKVEKNTKVVDLDWTKPTLKLVYLYIANILDQICDHPAWKNFMVFVIFCAGVSVGMRTDSKMVAEYGYILDIADAIILYTFCAEAGMKIWSEGLHPSNYFMDNWNCFDLIVIIGSFLPGSGSLVTVLRLMRLLRVLKLMRALKQLQIIVSALMRSSSSIGFVTFFLLIFFYFFAIIGMTLFGDNDPWHFGSLHMAMITLFDSATFDNWSTVMYISLYGCDIYPQGYGGLPWSEELCTKPSAQFIATALYWIIFCVVGGFVLLSLFIGVVTMGMEVSRQEQEQDMKIQVTF